MRLWEWPVGLLLIALDARHPVVATRASFGLYLLLPPLALQVREYATPVPEMNAESWFFDAKHRLCRDSSVEPTSISAKSARRRFAIGQMCIRMEVLRHESLQGESLRVPKARPFERPREIANCVDRRENAGLFNNSLPRSGKKHRTDCYDNHLMIRRSFLTANERQKTRLGWKSPHSREEQRQEKENASKNNQQTDLSPIIQFRWFSPVPPV